MQYKITLFKVFGSFLLCLFFADIVNAQPTNKSKSVIPIPSVGELRDVSPDDWAYSALQNLIKLYGFPQGYGDGTFRGDRPLSRYEFAAALNHFSLEVLDSQQLELAQDDLKTLRRLQRDFASELEALKLKVDKLDQKVDLLESNQFSTTTKLSAQVIFSSTVAFGEDKAIAAGSINNSTEAVDDNLTLNGRVRLFFNTSFTGQDLLRVRLLAGNVENLFFPTGTNMARLSFDSGSDNNAVIDQLFYRFPLADNVQVTLMSVGTLFVVADPINPLLGSDGQGSPFLFGIRSPIYQEEIGGTGIGVNYDINSQFNLSAVYLAEDAELPVPGAGLFNGGFSALGQLTWKPSQDFKFALVYSRSLNSIDINATGQNTIAPFGDASESITADSYGIVTNWQISSKLSLGGWAGFVQAQAQDLSDQPTAEILYYTATLTFSDLAQEGDLAALFFGQPPRLINNEFPGIEDPDPAFNLGGFYRFQVRESISVTPGFLVVFNPEHNDSNDPVYVGTIRTTFSF